MNKFTVKQIAIGGIIAAVYVAMTLINPLSFGPIQFRFSEILVLFCFYNPIFCVPMIVGCFLANLIGSPFPMDILFGTLGTALAVFPMSKIKNIWLSSLLPVVTNAVCVGVLLTFFVPDIEDGLLLNMGFVGLGQLVVVTIIGVPLFRFVLEKNKSFIQMIKLKK
jgi:uncharacterized membrane protein